MVALSLLIATLAFALERVAGYPDSLIGRIGHPVMAMGAVIDRLDRSLNREDLGFAARRWRGVLALLGVLVVFGAPAVLLSIALRLLGPVGWVLEAGLASSLLASRSLQAHVRDVDQALQHDGVEAGRTAVARIVGRDVTTLDAAAIRRAAIESLAENYSDGVLAPVFWLALLGLPGVVIYKAVNTADSMIGHRTPRHAAFGWAAARLDDGLNLIPARLTGALIALVSGRPGASWAVMRRDARLHRSPNAGWPEAAMAGALDVRLSGPRIYAGQHTQEPWVNPKGDAPEAAALARALKLTARASWVVLGVLAAGVAISLSAPAASLLQ